MKKVTAQRVICNERWLPRFFHFLLFSFRISLLPLLILLTLISCRNISPLTMERERAARRVSFEDFTPLWLAFAENEVSGLFFMNARIAEPALEIWALKADLDEPSLRIVISGAEEGRVSSTRVSTFVRDNGLLAGINAAPFRPVPSQEGVELFNAGIVISDTQLVSAPVAGYDALVFWKEGQRGTRRADIMSQEDIEELDAIENAIGGFRIILQDGKLPERLLPEIAEQQTDNGEQQALQRQDLQRQNLPRHPRSAAGLCIDGRTLFLLVIDGRRAGSIGATEAETGLILKKMGAFTGLNFDGGGSTALALRYPDGFVRTVNTPIHGGIPGWERAVAACLGLGTVEVCKNCR